MCHWNYHQVTFSDGSVCNVSPIFISDAIYVCQLPEKQTWLTFGHCPGHSTDTTIFSRSASQASGKHLCQILVVKEKGYAVKHDMATFNVSNEVCYF